ncbi:MAG: HNH endonuclease [Acidobacteria bacterium]|nr:HNH endonuclease [Acidobacteriota bacterium]
MPHAPKRPCTQPGCSELTDGGLCEKHRRQIQREYENRRGSSASRGYGNRWRKAREYYLQKNPFCIKCGPPVLAAEVDHRQPHRGDMSLFWDRGNWQGLCKACHSRKTAEEDGR